MDFLENFQQPDKAYSVLAFWFLNGELDAAKLEHQIEEMVDKGVYGGFMHPRAYLKTPYLEEEWWKVISACIAKSKEQGFKPWLYDEYAWPSGTAGSTFDYGFQKPSRTLAEGKANMAKGLYAKVFEHQDELQEALTGNVQDPMIQVVEKDGKYYAFYQKIFPKAVDYLNPDTITKFIQLTHEEYKNRYGSDFGSLIPGVFFDEIYMMGNPIPWTESLPDRFLENYGYNLMEELPSLIDGTEEHDKQVRKDYFSLIAGMYEEAFFIQIFDWCQMNNLQLTGHTEEFLWEHPKRQGNYFKTMKHLMIPGSDCHDYRYRYPRRITYCEPKYAVSVARAYNKERAMSEAMGGAGWNCSLEEFKKGINTLAAMGTNMFILHGFYYECEHQGSQSDWPTSFFYQNPYWKYFKVFAGYVQRICYMNSIGRPIVNYGILYPVEDMYEHMLDGMEDNIGVVISNKFHEALNIMLENQMDTDMVDSECLMNGKIVGEELWIGQQHFKLLLLPQGTSLSEELEDKLSAWMERGGKILFYKTNGQNELAEVFKTCRSCEIFEIPQTASRLTAPDVSVIDGDREKLFINHRAMEDYHYYFITNGSDEKKRFVMEFHCTKIPSVLNVETGIIKQAEWEAVSGGINVKLILEANEAIYLIFGLQDTGFVPKGDFAEGAEEKQEEWITGKWNYLPLSADFDDKWSIDAKESELEIPLAGFATDLGEDYSVIRICNTKQELGNCARHISLWNGSWITRRPSWNDEISASDLYFRKIILVDYEVDKVDFCVAAIDAFEIFINGISVMKKESNGQPVNLCLKQYLKKGVNLIAIHVINHHPLNDVYVCSAEILPKDRFISVLLQGTIRTPDRDILVTSDRTWIVNDICEEGWNQLESDKESGLVDFDVQKIENFNKGMAKNVWIHAWERGKPPMQPWGDLPLYGNVVQYPVKLYYTVTIPAGTYRIFKPLVSGTPRFFLDGKEVSWINGVKELERNDQVHTLIIRIAASQGSDGLQKPVRIALKPFKANLMDWGQYGIHWFSGRCMYTNICTVDLKYQRYTLDLGKVNFYAEIWINRKLAAVKIWPPYRIDITDFLQAGENEITIVAANSEGNARRHMLVDEGMALGWNRYWNEDNIDRDCQNYVSGLLGPVRLITEK
ncbi:MAG: glycosyl hydrolase [Anaerocolumna sp.]